MSYVPLRSDPFGLCRFHKVVRSEGPTPAGYVRPLPSFGFCMPKVGGAVGCTQEDAPRPRRGVQNGHLT